MGLFGPPKKRGGPYLKVIRRKGYKWSVYNYTDLRWYTDRTWTNKKIAKQWLRKQK